MRSQQLPTAWLVLTLGLVALTLLCGDRTALPWDTAAQPVAGAASVGLPDGWATYRNDRYGYSFGYPSFCRLEPLPGACKAQPPEAREPACRCFLNGEDPDNVLLQAYLDDGNDLVLATWQVTHARTPAFNPPRDADLGDWLREHFPWLRGVPGTPNVAVDGVPAVEILTPRSPTAPSALDIVTVQDGRLFRIQMLDTESTANAALYGQLLRSFQLSPSP